MYVNKKPRATNTRPGLLQRWLSKYKFKPPHSSKLRAVFLFALLFVVIVDIRQQRQQKAPEQYH